MRLPGLILFLLFSASLFAQVSFKTIAPQKPVVEGESFQVQYVLEDGKRLTGLNPQLFRGFRMVTGPDIYAGHTSSPAGPKSVQNIVYTLEAIKPGVFVIPGATVVINGQPVRSNDLQIEVISKSEAYQKQSESNYNSGDYFLRPGEDPYRKIKENLYVKVTVDKRSCLVGEPVLATFKLYSRLESKSDIVKNPGLYGFTVYDMINLTDKEVNVEQVNGRKYDVHTIRKVQLYPLQPGAYIIDPMEIRSRVEFSRSEIVKRTEQEIVEGVLHEPDNDEPRPGTEVFETTTSTDPVTIQVKSLPANNRPDTFSGAVGKFVTSARVSKDHLARNEQGVFEVTISGKGNFVQVDAPLIKWPEGLEGFEVNVKDEFSKNTVPISGSRTFRYPFMGNISGRYELPVIEFSYYDMDSNSYQKIETKPLELEVTNEIKTGQSPQISNMPVHNESKKLLFIITGTFIISILVILYYRWNWKAKKQSLIQADVIKRTDYFAEIDINSSNDHEFFKSLQQALWNYATGNFGLRGSEINKQSLKNAMLGQEISPALISELIELIELAETGIFTRANIGIDRSMVLNKARETIEAIEKC